MCKTKQQIDSEAAGKALDEKWYALVKGEEPKSYECALCVIYENCRDKVYGECPLYKFNTGVYKAGYVIQDCCDQWFEYDRADGEDKPTKATIVVDLLEAIRDAR